MSVAVGWRADARDNLVVGITANNKRVEVPLEKDREKGEVFVILQYRCLHSGAELAALVAAADCNRLTRAIQQHVEEKAWCNLDIIQGDDLANT